MLAASNPAESGATNTGKECMAPNSPQQDSDGSPAQADSADKHRSKPLGGSAPWLRLTGAGIELAFVSLAFGAIGWGLDRWAQSPRPLMTALAGLIGFAFGMYRFIRLATSVSAQQRRLEDQREAAQKPED